jgi:predicted GTPase
MLRSRRPVVAVCAVRTGCGKSPTSRHLCRLLRDAGRQVVVVRHPMPYGDLARQRLQRFAEPADFDRHACTIEEREEYEPLIEQGITVFSGVDYRAILTAAETEAEVIVWDGGNNDTPFFAPDLHLVLLDPHRPGDESAYWPGETNLLLADVAIIGKVDSAPAGAVEFLRRSVAEHNPGAELVLAELAVRVAEPERISGRRVLVVEDGPSLTHGGMPHGAGLLAARRYGAAEVVDPRSTAVGSLVEVYRRYPHIGPVLPAMGYSPAQIADLAATIGRCSCDLVLFATPAHLPRLVHSPVPMLKVRYDYRDHGSPTLADLLRGRLPELFAASGARS